MEHAFILSKQGRKLFNLRCQITASVKSKLDAGDVFTCSAKAAVKDADTAAIVLITVESLSRFVSSAAHSAVEAKLIATVYGDSILDLAKLDWDGLSHCADLPVEPAPDAPPAPSAASDATIKASFFLL